MVGPFTSAPHQPAGRGRGQITVCFGDLIEGHGALCCAPSHNPSSVMSQSTHEKVVMGLVNGHRSQTAQIKNDDGHLKPIVSSADGGRI